MRHIHSDCFAVSSYVVIYTDVWGRLHVVPYSSMRELWVEGVVVVLMQLLGGRRGSEWGVL
jgi:hypothetical protein